MAFKGNKKKNKALSPRRLPTKRTINLAVVGEKPLNLLVAVPAILVILVAAGLLSKFAVVDRLTAVSRAQAEVASLQASLDAGYEAIEGYGDLVDEYAHYTLSGMTEEELQTVDRTEVISMLQRVVLQRAKVGSWTITGNRLDLPITGATLQQINMIVQQLEEEDLVDFCTVSTAATSDTDSRRQMISENTVVTAQVIVYLNPLAEGDVVS